MILYTIITEKGQVIAFFLKEKLAQLYCEQGRNLKYEKIEINSETIQIDQRR